jgi:general secretion pathway protein I
MIVRHEPLALKSMASKFLLCSKIGTHPCIAFSLRVRQSSGLFVRLDRLMSHKSGGGKEAGFTLVEVVVALAILALSLAVLLGVISNGIRQSDRADKLAQAGSLAQSLLARVGSTDLPIQLGQTAGSFPDGFRWRVHMQPYTDAADPDNSSIVAYAVSVEVLWGDSAEEQSVALNTLRLAPGAPGR